MQSQVQGYPEGVDENGIKIDIAGLRTHYKTMMAIMLADMLESFLALLKSEFNMSGSLAELDSTSVKLIQDRMVGAILGGPWVLMENYGRGSEMDEENLWKTGLKYVLNPQLWNEARESLAISTRARPYTNIFGDKVESTGSDPPPGIDIEHLPGFEPWAPTYHLENTLNEFMQFEAIAIINNYFYQFPWHRYIIGTKNRMRD